MPHQVDNQLVFVYTNSTKKNKYLNKSSMLTKKQQFYMPPKMRSVEIGVQTVLCESNYHNYTTDTEPEENQIP